jgi:1,4-dihydroxy-2-naphthoate octaprenyltransferase
MTTRPRTLVASFAPVCIGSSFAIIHLKFSILTFLLTLATACLIQILSNFANDYFDVKTGKDTKERKGPKRGLHHGLISFEQMKIAMCIVCALIVACSAYLIYIGGPIILILMLVCIGLAFLYTAGSLSLASTGLADIVVFFFFGPIATVATYWLQTKQFFSPVFVSSLGLGCLATALLICNNLRDVDEDRKAGKRTLVVRFGINFGKWEFLAMMIGAFLVPIWLWDYYSQYSVMLISSALMLTAIPMIIVLFGLKKPLEFGPMMLNVSFLLLSYTLVMMFCVFYANRTL